VCAAVDLPTVTITAIAIFMIAIPAIVIIVMTIVLIVKLIIVILIDGITRADRVLWVDQSRRLLG
jgi:hypothetical protein